MKEILHTTNQPHDPSLTEQFPFLPQPLDISNLLKFQFSPSKPKPSPCIPLQLSFLGNLLPEAKGYGHCPLSRQENTRKHKKIDWK